MALLLPLALGGRLSAPGGTIRGGEVHDALRLSISTNSSAAPGVRLRAGGTAIRTYHLNNHAEYPLGSVVLKDPQLPGGQVQCGPGGSIPPGGSLDCTATLTVQGGAQSAQVEAVADAPNRLPQAHAGAPTGYLGVTAGLRLSRLGPPAGTGLTHRGLPEAAPRAVSAVRAAPATDTARAVTAVTGVGGTVELQYRLEAFGDVPITGTSITEGLPGMGEVSCAGVDGGRTLTPGQSVDCHATGTARPGRQTGTAHASGLADDATVGPGGTRQAPYRVTAEADGAYDGLRPAPPTPGSDGAPAPGSATTPGPGGGGGSGNAGGSGSGPGAGPGPGSGPVPGPGGSSGPGVPGNGPIGGSGGAGGVGTTAGGPAPAGLFPIWIPPGSLSAAVPSGPKPGAAVQGASAVAALPGQLLPPYLPGLAPAVLPGGRSFALPASPFVAPGTAGTSTSPASKPVGAEAADLGGAAADSVSSAAGPSPVSGRTPDVAAGPQQMASAAGRSPGAQGQAQFGTEDWPSAEEDDPWDGTEVMMLLLAILLPVLCVLAAAFTARNRGRR